MKNILFLFLIISQLSYSQEKSEFENTKFETNEYSIIYSTKLKLIQDEDEVRFIFNKGFLIQEFDNETKFNVPLIILKIWDCSKLGMGNGGCLDIIMKKKEKVIVKKRITIERLEFEELTYEEYGLTFLVYVYKKNNRIYELKGITRIENSKPQNKDIQAMMNSFKLK
ncbi:MAG: hypothetical protein V4548_07325 [Bacteroidota bacterium]